MFKKTYTKIDMKYRAGEKESARTAEEDAPVIPAGLWKKCNKCGKPIYTDDVRANFYICPKCGGYFRVHAYRRIEMIADEGSFEEWDKFMQVSNPLSFPGYEKKLAAAREKSQLNEAIVTGSCTIHGQKTVVGVCDARFLMSSMGHNVGEKDHESRGARHGGKASGDPFRLLRRRENAGRHGLPDADGKDVRCVKETS